MGCRDLSLPAPALWPLVGATWEAEEAPGEAGGACRTLGEAAALETFVQSEAES